MFLPSACPCSFLCFSLCICLCPSFCLCLCLSSYLCLSWVHRLPLVWCRSRPLCPNCLYAWYIALHSLLRASYPCSLVAFRPTCLRHSGSCGLCASIAALIVSWSVSELCLILPHKSFPLLQDLTSVSHKRKLQQLHQHRSVPSSVCRLPFFQEASPDFDSIRWIAQFREHLECSIFRVHRPHERKLSCSSFLRLVHTGQGHFSQRIRFHIHEFQVEKFFIHRRDVLTHLEWPTFPLLCFTRKRLQLVSNSEINQVYSGVWGRVNWSSRCSLRIDRRLLSHQLLLLTHLRFQLLQS